MAPGHRPWHRRKLAPENELTPTPPLNSPEPINLERRAPVRALGSAGLNRLVDGARSFLFMIRIDHQALPQRWACADSRSVGSNLQTKKKRKRSRKQKNRF